MPTYLYPLNRELMMILPDKVDRLAQDRLGLQLMPIREVNAAMVEWTQRDNVFGLQQLRGLDGAPTHVKNIGAKRYRYEPGVYGEFMTIGETELTIRAGSTVGDDVVVDVSDLVAEDQDQLTQRELDRIEQIIWLLLTTGTFAIAIPRGDGQVTVAFTDTFSIQTYTASVQWVNRSTAYPLDNFRSVQLFGRGRGLNFGANAKACMNRATFNNMIGNTNGSDLGGKKVLGGDTLNSLTAINQVLLGEGLPQIELYDEGYYDDTNTFQLYIPNNKVVVMGARASGEKIGEYLKTRNASNGYKPGSYSYTKDYAQGINAPKETPARIEVHQGHNGGPVLYFPGGVIVMNV